MTVRDLIRELLDYSMEAEVLVDSADNDSQILAKCTGVEGDEDGTVTIKSGS